MSELTDAIAALEHAVEALKEATRCEGYSLVYSCRCESEIGHKGPHRFDAGHTMRNWTEGQ